MAREYEHTVQTPHRALLEALTVARAAQHAQQARATRWLVGLGIAAVGLWPVAGFEVAMLTAVAGMVAALSLSAHGRGPIRRRPAAERADAVAREVERRVFQHVASDIATSFRIHEPSPITIRMLGDAELLRATPEFVHASRAVTGLHAGHIPFCVMHFEAGHKVQTRPRQPRHEYQREIFARAIVAVTDAPASVGRVVITARHGTDGGLLRTPTDANVVFHGCVEFDEQFAVSASSVEAAQSVLTDACVARLLTLRRRLPGRTLGVSIANGTLTVMLDANRNPFALGHTPAEWEKELDQAAEVMRQIATLLEVVHDAKDHASTRAA